MTGRDQTLYCLLSSHSPGASRKYLSLVAAGCPAVALARANWLLFPAECRVHRGYEDQTSDSYNVSDVMQRSEQVR